jgi:putative lipoic acid-binding regulatory protein
MSEFELRLSQLKLVLDETVKFPSEYLFKFIVPLEEIHQILFIMQGMEIEQKASSSGKYISVSGKMVMNTSEDIILVYKRASVIKGIISL